MKFQSSIAVSAVCEHCRSIVVLRDANVETMGVMAELPPDLSPFQIGTTGEWSGRGFVITGRVRVAWEDGSWNEWCLAYDGATAGWLAEAQGLLMISFATKAELPAQPSGYQQGNRVTIRGKSWLVNDVKQARCIAGEGELPFAVAPGESRTGVDLTDGAGGFASIEFSGEAPSLFVGQYASFDALKLNNLRPVPGWNADVQEERNRTAALACPSCGAAVNLRAAGQAMSAVCGSCGTLIDTSTPSLEIIQKANKAQHSLEPLLSIGQRGTMNGVQYEIIGYVQRADKDCKWAEYLLFNPWQGFQWLVNFNGHWTYVTRLPDMPDKSGNAFAWKGHYYRLFAKGRAEVTGVLGEFYWKVKRGEKADVNDYVAPPYILSKEVYPGLEEFTWSHGVYVEPSMVEEAFGVKNLPSPEGPYLNEPNRFAQRWREIKWLAIATLAILLLLQIFFAIDRPERVVTSANLVFKRVAKAMPSPQAGALRALPTPGPGPGLKPDSLASGTTSPLPETMMVTPHFQITDYAGKISIIGKAGVDNHWLDLDINLVNAKTNETFPAAMEISYYHGYDDGEWSEGSQSATATIPNVPPGEYYLTVEPDADPAISEMPFTVHVLRGGLFSSNLWACLVLVLCYPIYVIWRAYSFERTRWAESDYNYFAASDS